MPCVKCKNGKWRMGGSDCMYATKQDCEKAMKAYYAKKKNED